MRSVTASLFRVTDDTGAGAVFTLDGTQHPWLEGRGQVEPDVIGAIDEATNRVFLQSQPAESTQAVMRLAWDYIRLYGRPLAVYANRHSIYRTSRGARTAEQRRGLEPQTQLGRALRELDIECIPAHSPQPKGRIERTVRTHQTGSSNSCAWRPSATSTAASAFPKSTSSRATMSASRCSLPALTTRIDALRGSTLAPPHECYQFLCGTE